MGVDCMCQFCQFYTPVTATTMSCIFMPHSRYYMSSFWPKFLLSLGLILWLKCSYASGFVISSCCFRMLLSWAKFWYRSVLNGPNIKDTVYQAGAWLFSKWNWLRGWSVRVICFSFITWNAHSYQFTSFIPPILNPIQLCFFFIVIWWKCSVKAVEFFVFEIVGLRSLN